MFSSSIVSKSENTSNLSLSSWKFEISSFVFISTCNSYIWLVLFSRIRSISSIFDFCSRTWPVLIPTLCYRSLVLVSDELLRVVNLSFRFFSSLPISMNFGPSLYYLTSICLTTSIKFLACSCIPSTSVWFAFSYWCIFAKARYAWFDSCSF